MPGVEFINILFMFIMKLREQDSPNLWKMGHNVLWCDNCNSSSTVCDRKTNTCIKCQCWEEKSIYSKWYCIPLQYLSCPSGLEFVSFISWLLYMGKYQNLIQWKIRCVLLLIMIFHLVSNVTIYILESGDCTENMTRNHKNI